MRRTAIASAVALATVMAMGGTALANDPVGDPLPVNGEPNCFGARVSHSASAHGFTPKEKVARTEFTLFLLANGFDPPWEADYVGYYEANGVSVKSIQKWIRINCSDDPIIANL